MIEPPSALAMMGIISRDIRKMDFTLTAITASQSVLTDLNYRGSADDARIVEEYVNATEFMDGAFDHAPAVGRASHIGAFKDRAATGCRNFARDLLARFLVQVNNAHGRTLAGKKQCCGAANTAGAPGNESRLATEFPSHYS